MREIHVGKITDAVRDLCLEANFHLRKDVLGALKAALQREGNPRAKRILSDIITNAKIARSKRLAICQDTGMAVVFLEIGQDAALVGGDLREAVDEGVRQAYRQGRLRKSVVRDPCLRENTSDNTPSIIHVDIVGGDRVKITVSPKGFGSENKSAVRMFRPTETPDAIRDFVLETVRAAGADACPPLVLGVGIGGTFEEAALLAKKALVRPLDEPSRKRHFAKMERDLLKEINALGIGPMGLGGKTTALGVRVDGAPTHIAGLPVAVNVSCHATRSARKVI